MNHLFIGIQLLRQGTAHQEIPEIDDDAGHDNLKDARSGAQQRQGGVFACTRHHAGGHDKSLRNGHADVTRGNAERKSDGKISGADRDAPQDPLFKPLRVVLVHNFPSKESFHTVYRLEYPGKLFKSFHLALAYRRYILMTRQENSPAAAAAI